MPARSRRTDPAVEPAPTVDPNQEQRAPEYVNPNATVVQARPDDSVLVRDVRAVVKGKGGPVREGRNGDSYATVPVMAQLPDNDLPSKISLFVSGKDAEGAAKLPVGTVVTINGYLNPSREADNGTIYPPQISCFKSGGLYVAPGDLNTAVQASINAGIGQPTGQSDVGMSAA